MEKDNEKITTVCILTCNRPESLEKALTGLIGNLTQYGRTPRILVVDDSENPENMEQTKRICVAHQAKYSGVIECINRNDRAEMAKKLAIEKNVPEEVVHFALCGDKLSTTTVGAVRNTCLLKTRGEKMLMVDDDIICKTFTLSSENYPIFTIETPLDFWLLGETDPIPQTFRPVEIDLLSIHEDVLEKDITDILGNTTPDYLRGVKIMDTYIGLHGDSPMASHIPLLILPQVYEKLKKMSLHDYQALKETKHLVQSPTSMTIYQGPVCMSMCRGIGNHQLIPLFMPVGRAEDLVFGATRWTAFPNKLSAYIPFLVGHERPLRETRSVTYDSVREMTKMNRVIVSLINETPDLDMDPHENLKRLGDKFFKISNEPLPVFTLMMQVQCEKISDEIANRINKTLEENPDMPDFWIKDMRSIINDLNTPDPQLFMADITKNPTDGKMKVLQKWMGLYGQLLREWGKLI
jgi:hypothetical protein